MLSSSRPGAAVLTFLCGITPTWAQTTAPETKLETVIVNGINADLPNRIETIDAGKAQEDINAVNTEDMLKYSPSLTVRKRHYGDTQDPLATRTSGVGASARSLIFVDGILISSPIGNNNSSASPHFGIAAPQDVSIIDVLYGPFAAEYAGGSIGAVLNIATKMPDHLEIYGDALAASQNFKLYETGQTFSTGQLSVGIGDRDGAFSWRLSANHLDTTGQPLALVTLPQPAASSAGGTLVGGGVAGLSRAAAPIDIIGAGGIEHQVQDTDTLKLAYDFPNAWTLAYTASLFHQTDDATAQTYLHDGGGNPVYAGSVNSGGYNYIIATSSFSNNVYDWEQTHLAQGLSLKSRADGNFVWDIVAGDYIYLSDNQRLPVTALPAQPGTAGAINRLTGTGWYTLDAKAVWQGWTDQILSAGIHRDQEAFSQVKTTTADWTAGAPTGIAAIAKGRTAADALWLQDIWSFAPQWKAIIGGRYEIWRAYDGLNFSATPALHVSQPQLSTGAFSPKASLAWQPGPSWSVTASWGGAWRMPTVTELYQAITTGSQLTVPNPNLKPEHADSYELAAEYKTDRSRLRLSLFEEDITHALLSQSAPLLPGSATLFSFVQNVDRTRARGIELVADQNDVLFSGLELSGSLTFVDGRTIRDTAFPAAVGKFIPQLPKLRGDITATWRPDNRIALTVAARYSDRSFGTIDNSDPISQTFQGFARYLVVDTRLHYRLDDNWSAAIGIDNLNNEKYFLFHPFPQRSFVMEIHYAQ